METMAIDDIVVSNTYLRTQTDIETLKKSIETVGLINPLTVNTNNELLAGGRRYSALKELGITEVPIQRIDRDTLEQELISIDENLVRKPLDKLEFEKCLNRGREIYESLNPLANKVEIQKEAMTTAEKKQEKEDELNDTTSFAAITAEKTGLSKSVIKNAIKRDAKSSEAVKVARSEGELSASQVNEIIKLEKEDQDTILPYIKEKAVKEVKKIVAQVRQEGLEAAIIASEEAKELPKEMKLLETLIKRSNRQLTKILVENIWPEEELMSSLLSQLETMNKQTSELLQIYGNKSDFNVPIDHLVVNTANDTSQTLDNQL